MLRSTTLPTENSTDTQVLPQTRPPARTSRWFTAVGLAFVWFLLAVAGVVWYGLKYGTSATVPPAWVSSAVWGVFIVASGAFLIALFMDHADRRTGLTEDKVKEVERRLRMALELSHDDTRRAVRDAIREEIERNRSVAGAFHESTRAEVARHVAAVEQRILDRDQVFLRAFTALEAAVPELTKNARWSAAAELLRESMDRPETFPDSARPPMRHRRADSGHLWSVPPAGPEPTGTSNN